MLDAELLFRVLKRTLSRGGEYADIFLEQRRTAFIHLEDEKIEKVISGISSGVGIRLISKGKTFCVFSNDNSEPSLLEIADALNTAVRGEAAWSLPDWRRARPGADFLIKMPPDEIPVSRKIVLVKEADRVAR